MECVSECKCVVSASAVQCRRTWIFEITIRSIADDRVLAIVV